MRLAAGSGYDSAVFCAGVTVKPELIEDLLHEEEGKSLDFKQEQYRFTGNTRDKSELLKDILAFANAFRRDDAYILLGVEEVQGGRSKVLGVKTQMEDAHLQQFINSKTQRPVTFSYEQASHDGLSIGVIRIPVQARPLYAKEDFGVVRKNNVYIRRGSSTDVASPDEVARMRDADIALVRQPSLELDVVERGTRCSLGTSLLFGSLGLDNKDYHRDIASYLVAIRLLPVTLALRNTTGTAAQDVRVVFPRREQPVRFMAGLDMPDEPRDTVGPGMNFRPAKSVFSNQLGVQVAREGSKWRVESRFGKIQPGYTVLLNEDLLVGARNPGRLEVDGVLYADNLSLPSSVSFSLDFEQGSEVLTPDRLKDLARPVDQ